MFKDYFRQGRERAKLSQGAVATYLKVSPSAVSRWEKGVAVPETDNCRGLARLFRVPEEEVLRAAGHLSAEPSPPVVIPEEGELVRWLRGMPEAERRIVLDLRPTIEALARQVREREDRRAAEEREEREGTG